jgi:Arylsulfotransferase (ASST)
MNRTRNFLSLEVVALVLLAASCAKSNDGSSSPGTAGANGAAGANGGAGTTGAAGSSSTAGTTGTAGTSSTAGTTGTAGTSSTAGTTGAGGRGGTTGSGGRGGTTGTAGSSAGGAGGTASDPGTAPSAITGLTIEANPKNVLSCFVSWTTDKAANSTVQFGQSALQWEIADATLTTTHKVLVIGMKAQLTYMIKAISANSGGSVNGMGTFTTGTLPAQIPNGTVMINDATKSQPGWTLMNVQKGQGDTRARSDYPPYAVMYDSDGKPVWYYVDGTMPDIGGAVSTQLTDKGVLIGPSWNTAATVDVVVPIEVDFAGNTVWQCSTSLCGNKNFTHHASKLSNGNYMLIEYIMTGSRQDPIFREVNSSNQVVWNLDYAKLVTPPAGASGDWCHANSITVDVAKNVVYANCRWAGLLKASHDATPVRQWLLTGMGKGSSVPTQPTSDFTFSPTSSAFSDTHDPEIHDDGTICFFDNGGYSGGAGGSTTQLRSRAVEYMINETAKTATLTWEFPAGATPPDAWYTNNWYTPFWGDVDRLPNGNYLVAAGIRSPTVESRVFEVTKSDKKVVWEFRFPPDYGVYRADRITPPLIKPIN